MHTGPANCSQTEAKQLRDWLCLMEIFLPISSLIVCKSFSNGQPANEVRTVPQLYRQTNGAFAHRLGYFFG